MIKETGTSTSKAVKGGSVESFWLGSVLFPLGYGLYSLLFYVIGALQCILILLLWPIGALVGRRLRSDVETSRQVAIVGAGLRGLCSAVWLKNQGVDVVIFEADGEMGGSWRTISYKSSTLQMPSIAYTFHRTNRWVNPRAKPEEILANISRMVEEEGLHSHIRFGTPVQAIERTPSGTFTINGRKDEEFDGVLVCTGQLVKTENVSYENEDEFRGKIVYPYTFRPEQLHQTHTRPLIVGGGASSMEHIGYALAAGCETVYWAVRSPRIIQVDEQKSGSPLHDLAQFSPLWMSLVPWLIRLIEWPLKYRAIYKSHGMETLYPAEWTRPAIPQFDIYKAIKDKRVRPYRGNVVRLRADGADIECADGNHHALEVDVVVNCTGFRFITPPYVNEELVRSGAVVVADCPSSVTFTSYGLGNASMHAKLLYMHIVDRTTRPSEDELVYLNMLVPQGCWQQRKSRLFHLSYYFVRYLIQSPARRKWLFWYWSLSFPSIRRVSPISSLARIWAPVFAPFGL